MARKMGAFQAGHSDSIGLLRGGGIFLWRALSETHILACVLIDDRGKRMLGVKDSQV